MERTIREGINNIFDRCDLSISFVLHSVPDVNGIWNFKGGTDKPVQTLPHYKIKHALSKENCA